LDGGAGQKMGREGEKGFPFKGERGGGKVLEIVVGEGGVVR